MFVVVVAESVVIGAIAEKKKRVVVYTTPVCRAEIVNC